MIEIKDIQGNILLSVPITQSCQKVEELMVNDYIQLSWNSDSSETLPIGSYIEYNGEKYSLIEPYSPSQKNEAEFVYTPQFKSRVISWSKKPFFFYSGKSKEPDWTLTSNPADFMRCICDAIKEETGEDWSYSIDVSLTASASLSFSSADILSGLNQIADAFETEWYADKSTNTIYLGLLSHGDEVTLEVGENINVPSVQGSKEGFYTRFYAFGSTRNITQDYEGSNTNNLVNKRLTLDPFKYPNGYKDIKEGLTDGEIFSKVLIFDDVYPSAELSISGVRNRLMYRLDSDGKKIQLGTDESGNPIYDQYAIWYFRIEGFDFDLSNIIEGYKLSVSFQSGSLQGREFELKYYDKNTTITTSDGVVFEAKAGDYEVLFVEEGSYIIPSMTGLVPNDGDSIVLFNIKMPSEYTQSAYNKLESELDKEILRINSDLNNYTFKSNPVAFNENNPNLSIGRNVRYVNGAYSYNTRVIKLITHIDFPIEQEITIGNEKVKGNTQQLKEEVASANKDLNLLAVFNDMTQSLQQSYNRTQQMMLDGFAAIKNIWQLKTDSNGNTYAFSAFDVVTQKGITMYADGGELELPSIYAGLPIDNNTLIRDVNGVLMINPDIDLGGGASTWDELIGKPTWIGSTKPSYNYSEILQTPDLSVYALAKDLEKYVTLGTAQTITGEKNFTGGLKVNGSPIVYDATNKYWKLEGDLLVTGGVTMYASDSAFTPSTIMDAIATDGTNLKVVNGVLTFVGSIDGGEAGSVAWGNVTGKPSFATVATSGKYSDLSGVPTLLSSFTNDLGFIDSSALSGYLLASNYTASDILTKLLTVDGSGSGLDADLLDGKESSDFGELVKNNSFDLNEIRNGFRAGKLFQATNTTTNTSKNRGLLEYGVSGYIAQFNSDQDNNLYYRWCENNYWKPWRTFAFTDSNVESATRLQTSRTIWGQSFDGTGNVDGKLTITKTFSSESAGVYIDVLEDNGVRRSMIVLDPTGPIGFGIDYISIAAHSDRTCYFNIPTSGSLTIANTLKITNNGNVLIGTTTDSGYKLDVSGTIHTNSSLHVDSYGNFKGNLFLNSLAQGVVLTGSGVSWHNAGNSITNNLVEYSSDGSVNIVSTLKVSNIPIYKSQEDVLYIDGNLAVRGGITMYATDAIDVDDVIKNLPIAGSSAKGIAAFNPNDFSVVDGYVSFIGSGGVDESVLADYAKKTDLSAYLPLSGGTISNDGYGLILNSESTNPSWLQFKVQSSHVGAIGAHNGNPIWMDKSSNQYTILHSGNWSQYVTAADGGSYLPLSGGRISNEGTGLYINRTTSGSNPHITFESQGAARGDIGVGYEGNPLFYSYGYEGLDRGWHRIFVDGGTDYTLNQSSWGNGLKLNRTAANGGAGISSYTQGTFLGTFGINGQQKFEFSNNSDVTVFTITGSGDVLAYGGITMYSDIRKKTKLQDVELSLKQIADAPLIEHYYNSDAMRTTHVGSIAQYWAGLNNWFCKLDSEGFYTMEIQNAALASAISIARELVKYESKTDKEIRLLKDEVKRLKKEIKILKSA